MQHRHGVARCSSRAPYTFAGCVDAGGNEGESSCDGASVFECAQSQIASSDGSCTSDVDCALIRSVSSTCVTICNVPVRADQVGVATVRLANEATSYCADQPSTCGAVRVEDSLSDCVPDPLPLIGAAYCDAGLCAVSYLYPDGGERDVVPLDCPSMGERLDEIARESAFGCNTTSDCARVNLSVSCLAQCDSAVLASKVDDVDAGKWSLNESCASTPCGSPACGDVTLVCAQGVCELQPAVDAGP